MTKTTLSTALALTITLCGSASVDAVVPAVTKPVGIQARRLGDVDGDGDVTLRDATAILAYLYEGAPLGTFPAVADVDRNGQLSLGDALLITQYGAGYEVGFSATDYVTAGISNREARRAAYDAAEFAGAVQIQAGPGNVLVTVHDFTYVANDGNDLFLGGPLPPNARIRSPYETRDAYLVRIVDAELGEVFVTIDWGDGWVDGDYDGKFVLAKVVGRPEVTVTIECEDGTQFAPGNQAHNGWYSFFDIDAARWD